MHDDVSLTTGRARRVLDERIRPAIHGDALPLTVTARELRTDDGGVAEPIRPAEGLALDLEPYETGTPWGPAWSTTWFRLRGTVPAEWAGRAVEVVVDLGFDKNMPGFQCEGLVYRPDGTPVKSLNPRNQYVPVTDAAAGGEEVDLFVEAAANPVLLDYHPFLPTQEGDVRTASREKLYTSRRMDLAVFHPEVLELALDVEVLLELQAELPAGSRRARILQALDDGLDVLDLQDIPGTAPAARAALAPALEARADASAHEISAVGHAHIDSAWLWPVRETIRKVARTASSMTDLIDRTDDFAYGMSSAQQYAWIKEHRPEVWDRVKRAVAGGRFLPLGGMWVESDTVMPTGESLVRQFSQGQRFFEREFGIRSAGVWLPDSFGYSPALPQLVRRAGFEWFFTQKISWNQVNVFPHHTFWWEGIDASRVLTHFPPMDTYNSRLSGEEVAKASRQFREARKASGSIAPVGWGDGGGGTTREMVGIARRLGDLEGSARVRWEHPDAFFARAREEISRDPAAPVWVGELYLELHRATLTSQHKTKQGNRRSERLLLEAETWATTAALRTGAEYPYDELDELWQQTLLLQFHDILPGTSIAWVHREAVAQHEEIARRALALIERSLAALTGAGDREIVANPAAFGRDGVPAHGAVVVPGTTAPGAPEPGTSVSDDAASSDDASVPDATVLSDAAASATIPPPSSLTPDGDGWLLTNDVIRVRIDRDGHITSAVDLASGRDAIAPGTVGNLLQLHQDFPNMWDAWDVDRFYRNSVTDLVAADAVEPLAGDAVPAGTAGLEVRRSFGGSAVVQRLTLAPGSRTVEVDMTTDWRETEKFLKVAFPLDVRAESTVAETQFGFHRRPTHANTSWEAAKFETSMHRWVLADEPGWGVALVNDSVYGHDVTRDVTEGDDGTRVTTTVRLSLLRAPRFPDPVTDQGPQTHRYGLVVGADPATATREGELMNAPARVVRGDHGFDPLVTTRGEGIVLAAVKRADDRSGDLVVRVHEALGRRTSGSVTVHAPVGAGRAVSLLEDDAEPALTGATRTRPEPGDGSGAPATAVVGLDLNPFEVRTLRFPAH
ncbi:alpha-mannosidase [Myceligenerans pegani]|uniref:Alpha-mannosidase n=1 Tax=Myceligenerans pegani TaxID=2776917 RepID=A0ABR9N1B5_9MICO|nr:glycoside hydrolase family 38 C-terminal domain-containing protein [Myceligenerans sp. TRM 65318]MBE1877443.1 alpha-mannosidase [Myceligenerans sp. TRM 65318]MBE3019714.1 alpha-mannosidase [Myceligenerans sp. TRM 65318]